MVRAWKFFPFSQLQFLLRAACTMVLGAAAGPSMGSRMQVSKVQSQILVMVMCSSWGRDEHLRERENMIKKGKKAEVPSNNLLYYWII